MNFLSAMETSSSGMAAQRYRMNIISSNIANAHTTRTPSGGPYQRREVVFGALPAPRTFEQELRAHVQPYEPLHVKVLGVATDNRPPVLRFDPSHPDANEEGFVALPNIDPLEEMIDLMLASRSYQANVVAFNATKTMALRAMDIGRR